MMERLRERLWLLRQRMGAAIRPKHKKNPAPPPIKGNMQNIIVVKPQNKMFSQAVFVLSDDYVRQSRLSSQELLRQAREAAGEYTPLMQPQKKRAGAIKLILIFLVCAAFLLGTYYFVFMPA